MTDDDFDLRYDTIVLDDSESLMNHLDVGAMNHKNWDLVFPWTNDQVHA